jgi:hypothetical protein
LECPPILVLLCISAFCRLHHRKKKKRVTHNKLSRVEKQREGDENIIAEMERDTGGAFEC